LREAEERTNHTAYKSSTFSLGTLQQRNQFVCKPDDISGPRGICPKYNHPCVIIVLEQQEMGVVLSSLGEKILEHDVDALEWCVWSCEFETSHLHGV
jgi:hypothetical protein